MDWDVAAKIATSVGALLAAGSLVVGLGGSLLYRKRERDELATEFRRAIATTQPQVAQLNDMVSFEVACELASTVVYSRSLELPLRDLFEYCRPPSGQGPDREEIEQYLEANFPPITVPFNTPLISQYQALTASVAAAIALYRMTFPGIFRVVNSFALLLRNVLANEKAIARDENLWKAVLPELIEEPQITSLDHLKWTIAEFITGAVMTHMKESREQIGLLAGMLDMVIETHLDKTAGELRRLSRREGRERIRSVTETIRIPEDLREAERCLRHAFPREEQLLLYRGFLDNFEVSGDKKNV